MADEFPEWLKRQMDRKGLSSAELSRRMKISPSAISRWLGASGGPDTMSCARLAEVFGVPVDEVYRAAGHPVTTDRKPQPLRSLKEHALEFMADLPVAIPIHDQIASAGFGQEVLDYAYWSPPQAAGRNIVGLKVHGNSMEPEIKDGDVIYIDRDESPSPGRTVVATIRDEVVVKKLRRRGDRLMLVGKTGEMDAQDAKIEGVVIQLSRDVR